MSTSSVVFGQARETNLRLSRRFFGAPTAEFEESLPDALADLVKPESRV